MKPLFATKSFLAFALLFLTLFAHAQVKIGYNPETINAASILEMEDTTRGILVPRMTTTQRDAISSPPDGLQVYNTTTSSMDVFRNSLWESTVYNSLDENVVYVYSLDDLPAPSSGAITLDSVTLYLFKGIVNISPNYLDLNGATLRGVDPAHDGVASTVAGGILRSTDVSVYIDNLSLVPLSGSTKAFDFSDATKTKLCNLFSGTSVIENGIASLGVGQVSGFKAVSIFQNYWKCTDGIKVTGETGKFTCSFNLITNITSGAGIEFLSALDAEDIDISNVYFTYSGQTGVKFNSGATVGRGRMTTNIFRDVGTPLDGIDSYTSGWSMNQNTGGIPNSRAYSFIYFNGNSTSTSLPSAYPNFYKIAGATTTVDQKRFTNTDNKITYNDVKNITVKVSVVISAKAPANNSDFSIGLGKNGVALIEPISSMAASSNNQSFQIILNTEVDLVTGDYLEVYICRNNGNTSSITVEELQFRVSD